jgi:hypothetical protein
MGKKITCLVLLFVSVSVPAHALVLHGGGALANGESSVSLGFGWITGIVSPRSSFKHDPGFNKARIFEENVSFSHGFGDVGLKDTFLQIETILYQSREETYLGTIIHPGDNGALIRGRVGGNFIHDPDFVLGVVLEGTAPIGYAKEKFVNPVVNYVGGGINAAFKFTEVIALTQSVFLGSGAFSPRTRNPQIQSTTLGIFNFGKSLFNRDLSFKTGLVIEADLTSRTDAAYLASAYGNGDIQNLVFVTPFLLNFPFCDTWDLEAGYANKWAGKSARGSGFLTAQLSKRF